MESAARVGGWGVMPPGPRSSCHRREHLTMRRPALPFLSSAYQAVSYAPQHSPSTVRRALSVPRAAAQRGAGSNCLYLWEPKSVGEACHRHEPKWMRGWCDGQGRQGARRVAPPGRLPRRLQPRAGRRAGVRSCQPLWPAPRRVRPAQEIPAAMSSAVTRS